MATALILQALDKEIGVLQQVRSILAGKKVPQRETKRIMSPEGRKAIAAGQRRRWAKQRAA